MAFSQTTHASLVTFMESFMCKKVTHHHRLSDTGDLDAVEVCGPRIV